MLKRVKVVKPGKTVQYTMAGGEITKQMDMEDFCMQMETFTKVSG